MLSYVCEHLPLADIQILDIGPAHRMCWYRMSFLFQLLFAFKSVHTLQVKGTSAASLFPKLEDWIREVAHQRLVLPELSTIVLVSADLDICLTKLRSYLTWRREKNAAIERLEIRGCMTVTDDALHILESIVSEVWWDGENVRELEEFTDAENEDTESEDEDSEGEDEYEYDYGYEDEDIEDEEDDSEEEFSW